VKRSDCKDCYGEGEWQHPHNGDWHDCSCVSDGYATQADADRADEIRLLEYRIARDTERLNELKKRAP
jgi:hypothetical protein